jgi:hypothetical protein
MLLALFINLGSTIDPKVLPELISLMLMTAAAGVGALVGFICPLWGVGAKHGCRAFVLWLWFAAALVLYMSLWIC